MDKLISKREAAALAGVTPRTIDRWVRLGIFCSALKLPSGGVRFKKADVEDWLQNLPHLSRNKPVTGAWCGPDLEPGEQPASPTEVESADD